MLEARCYTINEICKEIGKVFDVKAARASGCSTAAFSSPSLLARASPQCGLRSTYTHPPPAGSAHKRMRAIKSKTESRRHNPVRLYFFGQ